MHIFSSTFATFRFTIAFALALGFPVACVAMGPCAPSPAAAVKAFESGQPAGDGASDGYRVTRMHRDAILGTRWASVERCGHPEWPGVTVPASNSISTNGLDNANHLAPAFEKPFAAPAVKVVRTGETVRLWRQDTNVRLQMAAVSEESGAAGERIRLRVTAHQEYGESARYVYGLVRGPADVEME